MTESFMVTDAEIGRLLYHQHDGVIAYSLGIPKERVAILRAANQRPAREIAPPTSLPKAKPLSQQEVLTPTVCQACGAPLASGRVMVTHIQALVAAYYKIPFCEMTSARRHKAVAHPRQVAMYLSKQLTPKSLPDIGRRFGGRDHTTVIYAISQVQKRILEDAEIEADVKALRDRLAA